MDTILVVEDRTSLLKVLTEALKGKHYEVDGVTTGTQAIKNLQEKNYHLVITDLKLPGPSGLEILRYAKELDRDLPVIIITAFGTVDTAIQAIKEGAEEFLVKPVNLEHLLVLVERLLNQYHLKREVVLLKEAYAKKMGFPPIIGKSPSMEAVSLQVQKVAPTDTTVLILGESGTGKELIARAIHSLSPRKDKPFVAINCAAIPDTLIENELFGHEKGSYTGAVSRQIGKFELAQGGTIFLDEIGELSPVLQSKILRVLQEKSFERIGGAQSIQVDVRILAASNKNLEAMVKEGTFREDLYYRLSVFPIHIPPLRARKGDIILLAEHYLQVFCQEMGKPPMQLTEEAKKHLYGYPWPGNVRELQNLMERAVILSDQREIGVENLPLPPYQEEQLTLEQMIHRASSLREAWQEIKQYLEKKILEKAWETYPDDPEKAAELVGLSKRVFLSKSQKHGLMVAK